MEGTPDPGIEGADGMYWAGDPDFPPYPWLKGHGSIEAPRIKQSVDRRNRYPWLKGHGSIEAIKQNIIENCSFLVSMAERSWLH